MTENNANTKRIINKSIKSNIVRLAVFVVIALIVLLIYQHKNNYSTFPDYVRKSAAFTVYYPKNIQIDQGSINLENNKLLTFKVHYAGNTIFVTEQPKPQYFDFQDFDKGIKSSVTVNTQVGNATVGKSGGRLIGDLPALDSWILASADINSSPDSLATVLKAMQKL